MQLGRLKKRIVLSVTDEVMALPVVNQRVLCIFFCLNSPRHRISSTVEDPVGLVLFPFCEDLFRTLKGESLRVLKLSGLEI